MDWKTYLHAIRKRETEVIFSGCPPHAFPAALELGAGDGYQSTLLQAYVDRLVVTDWDVTLLLNSRSERVHVRPCDAEAAADAVPRSEFDLVFSSNMLERHGLPNEYVYRATEEGGRSHHEKYFTESDETRLLFLHDRGAVQRAG